MTDTTNLEMTLVSQSQSQKEVTVNEALVRIDAVLNRGAIDQNLATPPGSPTAGDMYIVAASGTGDWAGHDGDITYYDGTDTAWKFVDPNAGITVFVIDENTLYSFDGTNWIPSAGISVFISGGSKKILLNKTSDTDTASIIFQTGNSGRAEFGTIGSDDFGLKVSANGSTFFQAFTIDKDTGDIGFDKFVGYGSPAELTIATGIITATRSFHRIDTESDAASDDLDTISGGTEGDQLIIVAENTARTVVVKDGVDNIILAGSDFSMDNFNDTLTLLKRGSNWYELSRSNNGA